MSEERTHSFPYHLIPAALTALLLAVWIYRWMNLPPDAPIVKPLFRIARYSNLLPCFLGFLFFRSLKTDLRILLALVAAGVILEVASWISTEIAFQRREDANIMYVFHIYTIAEFILLLLIFRQWHLGRKNEKTVLTTGLVVLSLIIASKIYTGIWQVGEDLDTIASTVEGVVVVTLAVLTLINLTGDDIIHIFEDPRFWVVSAIMFYFAGNLIIFALGLGELSVDDQEIIWSMHSALNISANTLYAFAFYLSHVRAKRAIR